MYLGKISEYKKFYIISLDFIFIYTNILREYNFFLI